MGLRDKLRSPKDRGGDKRRNPTISDLARASKFDYAAYNSYGRDDRPSNGDDWSTPTNPTREPTAREKNIKNQEIPSIISQTKPRTLEPWEKREAEKQKTQAKYSGYTSERPYQRPDEDNF
jgi:hypothetical protein